MKKFLTFFSLFLLLIPILSFAQEQPEVGQEEVFQARVIRIIEEKEVITEDGSKLLQQNLKLKGLEGNWQDKEIEYQGISDIQVTSQNVYKEGDKVLVSYSQDINGQEQFYVIDYVRTGKLVWLAVIFTVLVVLIGRFKGLRALVSLIISFLIIMFFIVPRIMAGNSPVLIAVIGSLGILAMIIYLTEGINQRSHLAVISILISLICVGILSIIFTTLSRLTGLASEETVYLIGVTKQAINFKGLFLAGVIIGALGVLDDVVISQVVAVEQIKKANPSLSRIQIFIRAFKVGVSHLSSMVNTLFLAYAGAALPLLMLFKVNQAPFVTTSQVFNHEVIATEIVRTLTGSIGIALAVPIVTLIAAYYLKPKA